MRTVTERELAGLSRASIKRHGVISSRSADGFILDLEHAFFEAGLSTTKINKTGEDDCRIELTATYTGEPDDLVRRVLASLEEEIAFSAIDSAVSWTIEDGVVQVRLLTYFETLGAATACLRAIRSG